MNEAFLIVDVQYDFLPGGALGVEGGDQIVPIINQITGKFSIFFTPFFFELSKFLFTINAFLITSL